MFFDLQRVVGDFKNPTAGLRLRFGQVTGTAAGSISLTVAGSTTEVSGISYLGSYTPVVGDTVAMLTDGIDVLVIGSIV